MPKLTIEIEMDNDAFFDADGWNPNSEVARILTILAQKYDSAYIGILDMSTIRDTNGNVVGSARITGEKPDDEDRDTSKWEREAEMAIERGDSVVYDLADHFGQNFDNVKHMSWFVHKVAIQLKADKDGIGGIL